MESMPLRLLRRELGWKWNSQQRSDYKKLLYSLHSREEDRISLSINSLALDGQDDMNPIYHLEFSPMNKWLNIVAAADEKGFLTLVNTHESVKNKQKIVDRHRCHENALFSAAWSPHKGGLIATGSADQSIRLWDTSNGFRMLGEYKCHTRTVKTVKFHPSQSDVFASASRDGSIMFWDSRTSHESPENLIGSAHNSYSKKKISPEADIPVTDILFKDDNTIVSIGSSDGLIKFWDIRKTYKYLKKKDPVRQIPYPLKDTSCNGFSALCMDDTNNLYAATAGLEIFKFNLSTDSDKLESCFLNNANMQFCVKLDISRDGRFLVAGSMNSFAHVWDTWDMEMKDPFTYLEGQSLDCTLGCAVFSPQDPLTVVTGADDSSLMIWRVNNMKPHYKKSMGCGGSDSLPKAPLDSLRIKQKQSLQSIIPPYRRSQIAQVVGNWSSVTKCDIPITAAPFSTTFNLCSLLTDLPNFVIDGRMCHLPDRSHSTISRKQTWLGDFVNNEKEKRPSTSAQNETPPKRHKAKNVNSNGISGNFYTPPRKSPRQNSVRLGSGPKRKADHQSPSNHLQLKDVNSSSSILKYFSSPLRTSNQSMTEYPSLL